MPGALPEKNPSTGVEPHPNRIFIPKIGWEEMGMRDCGIPGLEGAEQIEQGRFKLDFWEFSVQKGCPAKKKGGGGNIFEHSAFKDSNFFPKKPRQIETPDVFFAISWILGNLFPKRSVQPWKRDFKRWQWEHFGHLAFRYSNFPPQKTLAG